ncbi:hypothetical protein K450DRAFT_274834 [Umbelopsis ramanniana AG]|uniref:Uncharacterized protein n=1 Tax=Umbelopsis ramanniana AG TaxID=1314678 RepID=A0AAD5H9M9_UMBRA|nr:uncharacterized protein K450DRAFT_274834 [Umbelopsis ramanniana AG]KAI8576375.1 hypothetical protein K450DRAFT_274834 [Umbelopsis ramanniana AG]
MEHAPGVIAQAIILILDRVPKAIHSLKRFCQATTWTDWPDHIRANIRDWVKDILARVFETTEGNVVPGLLLRTDGNQWGRRQGCALTLSAHAGHSTEQYLTCVIVLLATLPQAQRSMRLDRIRNHLDHGIVHVQRQFSDQPRAERNRARREYAIWRDALCEGILRASGQLNLGNNALTVPVPEVDDCLRGLLNGTTVMTEDTFRLINEYRLEPTLRRGYLYN